MPMIVRTINEIMHAEKRDLFVVQFDPGSFPKRRQSEWRTKHRAWFDARGLRYEVTAPSGWLEGDAGMLAVYFDGLDDPRIADYTAEFENPDGSSQHPDDYQASTMTYASWLEYHPDYQGEPDFED